jgi:hypothetical protein
MFTLYYALNTCPSQVEMPTRMSFFQSPTMLHMLMTTIYSGCQTGSGAKRNVVVRLRKPEGNA